jgi:hypothetical protein
MTTRQWIYVAGAVVGGWYLFLRDRGGALADVPAAQSAPVPTAAVTNVAPQVARKRIVGSALARVTSGSLGIAKTKVPTGYGGKGAGNMGPMQSATLPKPRSRMTAESAAFYRRPANPLIKKPPLRNNLALATSGGGRVRGAA